MPIIPFTDGSQIVYDQGTYYCSRKEDGFPGLFAEIGNRGTDAQIRHHCQNKVKTRIQGLRSAEAKPQRESLSALKSGVPPNVGTPWERGVQGWGWGGRSQFKNEGPDANPGLFVLYPEIFSLQNPLQSLRNSTGGPALSEKVYIYRNWPLSEVLSNPHLNPCCVILPFPLNQRILPGIVRSG